MVEIFKLLSYSAEKALEGKPMGEWGTASTKDMVDKCKTALNERYGSWNQIDSFRYLIEDIEKLFVLIDDLEVTEISEQIKHYLTELVFVKMEQLRDLCYDVDRESKAELE